MTLIVPPKKLATSLLLITLTLTVAYVATQLGKYLLGHDYQLSLVRLFDLNGENNIPSWYASSTLLLCAGLLAVIWLAKAETKDPYSPHWLGLAVIFLYLSIDEAASVHERVNWFLSEALHTTGYLYYAWIIPGGIGVLIVVLAYARFIAQLPLRTMCLFLTAGLLYVGGALGVEALAGRHDYLHGTDSLIYSMFVAWEEGFEMLGIVILTYALCAYMTVYVTEVRVIVGERNRLTDNCLPSEHARTQHRPALNALESPMGADRTAQTIIKS